MSVLDGPGVDPQKHALVDLQSGREWSYLALRESVRVRAEAIEPNLSDSVYAFRATPDADGVITLLAVWQAGLVAAPLNAALTEAEYQEALDGLAGAELPEESFAIVWTSGTSGRPRGLVLRRHGFDRVTEGCIERLGVGADDVWVTSLSPAHVGGMALIYRALRLGGTIVCPRARSVRALVELFDNEAPRHHSPTRLSLVPTQLHRLLEAMGHRPTPPSVRSVLIGGAHAPKELVQRALSRGWPIAVTYGASEMTSQIATATVEESRAGGGHVGRLMPGVEIRTTEDGELLVRGESAAIARVGSGSLEPVADRDGWVETGDIGSIDGDGFLRIAGRRIDRIVSGGVTVAAREVEDALRAVDGVRDACVVGLPDPEWGERIAAWVEVEPAGAPSAAGLDGQMKQRLSAGKRPRVWRLEGSLPRNHNGKVDRSEVRRVLADQV